MRLADFIATNLEPILAEWEAFLPTHVPAGEAMDVAGLRDHAADILKTVAADLRRPQTQREAGRRRWGHRAPPGGGRHRRRDARASGRSPASRWGRWCPSSGPAASVIRLWRGAAGVPGGLGLRGRDAVQRGHRPGVGPESLTGSLATWSTQGDVPRHPRARRADAPRGHHDVGDRAPHETGPGPVGTRPSRPAS